MKGIIMIVVCVLVAVFQTVILMWFLKRIKKIEVAFWGESAARAKEDIDKAREEERKKAQDEAAVEAS